MSGSRGSRPRQLQLLQPACQKNGATGTSRTYSADSRMSCLYRCLYCCMYRCCSPQSYIQSRGRARMLNSELLMFVQQDLSEERQASAGCCRC